MIGGARPFRRVLAVVHLVAMAVLLFLAPGGACADEASMPLDAPAITQGGPVVLPPLPVTYQVEKLGWWTLAYPASARERIRPLVENANAWKAELATDFGQDVLTQPIEVRVGRTWEDLTSLVPRELGVPPYAAGVTYGRIRLVVLSLTEPTGADATDLETVFRHELSHVALDDALDDASGRRVPRWFNEGLAIHESKEHPVRRMGTLWDATLFHQLLPFSELDRGFGESQGRVNLAYAESADVVRFLLRGRDQRRFVSFIGRVRGGETFDGALGDAYGTDVRRLEYEWREEAAKRNTFAPMLASGSFIWVIAFGALVLGYRRRRRDAQATLARWEAEELLAAAPRPTREDDIPFPDPARVVTGLPKIEHDGDWHTLH